MDGCGFKKNVIGTGVSVLEKKDIYDGVFSYIADIVRETEDVYKRQLFRRLQASQFVAEHGDQVCPAKWHPGEETLKPSLDLVGML